MTADCRPPVGTKDGTYCWLHCPKERSYALAEWRASRWDFRFVQQVEPAQMTEDGYHFHSFITPPDA